MGRGARWNATEDDRDVDRPARGRGPRTETVGNAPQVPLICRAALQPEQCIEMSSLERPAGRRHVL